MVFCRFSFCWGERGVFWDMVCRRASSWSCCLHSKEMGGLSEQREWKGMDGRREGQRERPCLGWASLLFLHWRFIDIFGVWPPFFSGRNGTHGMEPHAKDTRTEQGCNWNSAWRWFLRQGSFAHFGWLVSFSFFTFVLALSLFFVPDHDGIFRRRRRMGLKIRKTLSCFFPAEVDLLACKEVGNVVLSSAGGWQRKRGSSFQSWEEGNDHSNGILSVSGVFDATRHGATLPTGTRHRHTRIPCIATMVSIWGELKDEQGRPEHAVW